MNEISPIVIGVSLIVQLPAVFTALRIFSAVLLVIVLLYSRLSFSVGATALVPTTRPVGKSLPLSFDGAANAPFSAIKAATKVGEVKEP